MTVTNQLDLHNRQALTEWLLRSEASTFMRVLQGIADEKAEEAKAELIESSRTLLDFDFEKAKILAQQYLHIVAFKELFEKMRKDQHPDRDSDKFPFVVPKPD